MEKQNGQTNGQKVISQTMGIIDKYILKQYLKTFFGMILLFMPIGIIVDVSEKINRILESKVPFEEVAVYYLHFTIYFANLLFPLLLFLSTIWFTSKLANKSEIIAILSSGISFNRFLRPYFIGATIICLFAFVMGILVVPKSSKSFNDFRYEYLTRNKTARENTNVYREIKPNEFLYVSNFNFDSKVGFNFAYEVFDEHNKLLKKITASRINYNEKDSTYTLKHYERRDVGEFEDKLTSRMQMDTIFDFTFEELAPVVYKAETLSLWELNDFIEQERMRGNAKVNNYLMVKYKKFSAPISVFILTLIAVSVSSMKRRGGMGVNLAIGIAIAFTFVFFDKVFGTISESSDFSPMIAVWTSNILFGILAVYLMQKAKR